MNERDFDEIIGQCYPRLWRAAWLLSGDRWEADELAQETVLQAIRGWRRFAGRSRPDTWLYAILVNVYRKGLLSRRRRQRWWQAWLHENWQPKEQSPPEQRFLDAQWSESLWRAVAALPGPQREALVLRYSEELSYEEIGQALGCPTGTAKSRVHHGLLALRRMFKEPADQARPTHPSQT